MFLQHAHLWALTVDFDACGVDWYHRGKGERRVVNLRLVQNSHNKFIDASGGNSMYHTDVINP